MSIAAKDLLVLLLIGLLAGCTHADPTPSASMTVTISSPTELPSETVSPQVSATLASIPFLTPTLQPTEKKKINHLVTPESPPGVVDSIIVDPDSSPYASSRMAAEGDHFDQGLFERPFNSQTMDQYFPDLDIVQASLRRKGQWIYASVDLQGFTKGKIPSGTYGIEVDINLDGRGDILILTQSPGLAWSTERVQIWRDANHDIGGGFPVYSEAGATGDGFEQLLFDSGTGYDVDAAWARISPDNLKEIQIAFKTSVIDNDRSFYWRAWAQRTVEPAWFDYNDHFTLKDAGSPLPSQSQAYPLGELSEVDNTCRWGVGVTPSADEPGICVSQLAVTPSPEAMVLSGLVWYDRNTNFAQDPGEPGLAGAIVTVTRGECANKGDVAATQNTPAGGVFRFTDLQPGHYCVAVSQPPPGDVSPVTGSGPTDLVLKPGRQTAVKFPFVVYLR